MAGRRTGKRLLLSGKHKKQWNSNKSDQHLGLYTSTARMLATLGYSEQWLEYGILTPQLLTKQYRVFNSSEDKHPEHYRYGTFKNFLHSKTALTTPELTGYLQLTLSDKDSVMGGGAAQDLFTEVVLTDEQFELVCEKINDFPGDWTAKLLVRQQLIRQLENNSLSTAIFEECLAKGDTVVQKLLLAKASTPQLHRLASSGVTKAVRNLALAQLRYPLR